MIHYYEHQIKNVNPAIAEWWLLDLYNHLKKQIPTIDTEISGHADLFYLNSLENSGGKHGILFLLKSYDIDLRLGLPLGTVLGYGYNDWHD